MCDAAGGRSGLDPVVVLDALQTVPEADAPAEASGEELGSLAADARLKPAADPRETQRDRHGPKRNKKCHAINGASRDVSGFH